MSEAKQRVLAVHPRWTAGESGEIFKDKNCYAWDSVADSWEDAASKLAQSAPVPTQKASGEQGKPANTLSVERAMQWLNANAPDESCRRIAELLHDYSLTVLPAPPVVQEERDEQLRKSYL